MQQNESYLAIVAEIETVEFLGIMAAALLSAVTRQVARYRSLIGFHMSFRIREVFPLNVVHGSAPRSAPPMKNCAPPIPRRLPTPQK
jgi:hypothetical protein